jgi:MerR family transcriptional regulator, mercuric resistance operon regulatory protein
MTTSAIRFYEARGIVPAPRRINGVRSYEPEAVDRLRLVAFYRSCGVSISELTAIFGSDSASRRESAHAAMSRRIVELDRLVNRAAAMKRRLLALQRCRCDGERRRCVAFRRTRNT